MTAPNTGGIWLTRHGNILFNRSGVEVLTINPDSFMSRQIQQGIEIYVKYEPANKWNELNEEFDRLNKQIADAQARQTQIITKLQEINGRE